MANGRKQVDLGFAEFAAHVVAELHEGLLVAQNDFKGARLTTDHTDHTDRHEHSDSFACKRWFRLGQPKPTGWQPIVFGKPCAFAMKVECGGSCVTQKRLSTA